MPLVRIDVQEGRSPAQLRRLADVVQEVMLEVFDAPERDRYQIITVHPAGHIIAEDTNLGFDAHRRAGGSADLPAGPHGRRTRSPPTPPRRASRGSRSGCEPTDLIVSVVANERADWSFGLGRAQFLEGDL